METENTFRRWSIGKRLFLQVVTLFLLFAVLFVVFQQVRERDYKIKTLSLRLQDYNNQMAEAISLLHNGSESTLNRYVRDHSIKNLRVTVIDRSGKVIYDNIRKDYEKISSHANRKEFIEAVRKGYGTDISRSSETTGKKYFYSANYYPNQRLVIRTALPYNDDLAKRLATDQHYIWFAIIITIILIIILYRFTSNLGRNVKNLRHFSKKVEKLAVNGDTNGFGHDNDDESLYIEDLAKFPNDELGDISEHIVKLFMKLQRTRREQDILKRQLTQNISHELKTPVAGIQGYLETIMRNPDMSEQQKNIFLERCYAQSQRLTSLVRDISTLNRLDDAPDAKNFLMVNIYNVVEEIEQEMVLELDKHNMTINNLLPISIAVCGNHDLIYGIFRNLIDNAILYAGDGSMITIGVLPDSSHAESTKTSGSLTKHSFYVFDNGVGISPEHLPRLFERFYRVDKGRSRKLGGTGLGLAIVKNSVLLHGGSIMVSLNNPHGLRFDFTL